MKSILEANRSYTFSDYFNLSNPTNEVVAEFGYAFSLKKLELPQVPLNSFSLGELKADLYRKLPRISLTSEIARREFLIAPIFFRLLDYIEADLNVEYAININEKLKGNIDYLLRAANNLLVVEAKNADLEKGFTQLAVEMIAVDKFLEGENVNNLLYGAVTVGDVWRFGVLNREQKTLHKDIDAFLVPSDMENLFAICLGILSVKN